MKTDFEVLSSSNPYGGRIFDVFSDSVRLPNGNVAQRDHIKHSGSVAILPVDEDGTIHLVEQFRYVTKGAILEIPAGVLEEGEDRGACAVRELAEEMGFRAGKMERLTAFYPCPGYSDEITTLYRATGLERVEMNHEENEIMELRAVQLDEAIDMIKDGRIEDSKTIIALLYEKMLRNG